MWGIEISEESVACAIENQELNGIGNAAFFAGNVGEVLRRPARPRGRPGRRRRRPAARRPRRQGAEAARRDRRAAHRLRLAATRRRSPATRSGCATTTATGSCARGRSTCSRTRRTSSASRCSSARCSDDVSLQGLRDAVPADRRAAGRVPDLRGPAPVRPARHGQVWVTWDELRDGHDADDPRRPRHPRHRLHAVVRDRPARAAREERRRQRPLGLHPVPRRRSSSSAIDAEGGLAAIAISHPHYYSAMVEWAHAFALPGLRARGRAEVGDAPRSRRFASGSGETHELGGGLTLVRCGGHFEGGQVLHWAERRALLSGDIVQVIPDRRYVELHVLVPEPDPAAGREGARRSRDALEPFAFDTIYGAWWDRVDRARRLSRRPPLRRPLRPGGHRARAARRSRAPEQVGVRRAGSRARARAAPAGRSRSNQTVAAIVRPSPATSATPRREHAQAEAALRRRGRARRRAGRARRGSPPRARPGPGTRTRAR